MISIGNATIAVIPIILFIVGLILLSNLLRRINNKVKNIRWMLIGYVGLLVISIAVYFLLPMGNQAERVELDMEIEREIYGDGSTIINDPLYNHLENKTMEKVGEEFIREKWTFPYMENNVRIDSIDKGDNGFVQMYVEKVDDLEQEIEVIYYLLPLVLEGEDISKHTNIPDVQLSSSKLAVTHPRPENLSYTVFKESFPFRQFIGNTLMPSEFGYSSNLIYIKVPDHLELEMDNEIIMVEE